MSYTASSILLAEDNPINQQVATRMLRKRGYRVDVVATGGQAVAALSADPLVRGYRYAAVLMDCQMPEMDGYAATAAIRAHEGRRRHTAIIAMTADALAGTRERCLAAGMDDYLSKPVTAATLERWVGAATAPATAALTAGAAAPAQGDPLDRAVLDGLRALQQDGEPDLLSEVSALFIVHQRPDRRGLTRGAPRGPRPVGLRAWVWRVIRCKVI